MAINAWEVYIKCPFCGGMTTKYDYHENTSSDNMEMFTTLNVGSQSTNTATDDPTNFPSFICSKCGKEVLYNDIFTEDYCKVENLDRYKRSLINGIIHTQQGCNVSFSDWNENWGEEPALSRLIKMYPKDNDLIRLKKAYQHIHSHSVKSVTKYEINTETVLRDQFLIPEALKKVYLGNNVKTIAPHTFEGCKALCDVFLPESVVYVGEYSFSNSGLSKIHTSKNISFLGKRAFANTSISKFFFPDNIKEIQEECFLNCIYLESLWIPCGVLIGKNAFWGCKNLKKIEVPGSVADNDIGLWGLPDSCQIEKYEV